MPPKELWEAYSNRTVRPSRFMSGAYLLYSWRKEFQIWCVDASLGWRTVAYHFRVTVTLTLTSDLVFIVITMSVCPSVPLRVRCISPIFFELGIPNLMCGCILGWGSVAYNFRVTVTLTLTSDLVFRIIVSGAYLLYYLR